MRAGIYRDFFAGKRESVYPMIVLGNPRRDETSDVTACLLERPKNVSLFLKYRSARISNDRYKALIRP